MSAERQASPRTPERPMAFTTEEFVNGALLAWGLTILLLPVLMFPAMSIFMCTTRNSSSSCSIADISSQLVGAGMLTLAGAVLSIPTFLLFVLPAYGLNRVSERAPRAAVHISVNAALGLTVGAVGSFLAPMFMGTTGLLTITLPSAVAGAIAFPLAWSFTAARALRNDRGLVARSARRFPPAAV